MAWVRSEYAGELAVLSAWLGVLVPWNVTYSRLGPGDVLFVRFPFFQVRYTFGFGVPPGATNGLELSRRFVVTDVLSALAFQAGSSQAAAYRVWVGGAAVLAVALALSVAWYLREERVDGLSVDPVRVMGALLGLGGLALAAATYLLLTRGFPGLPVPVGVVVLVVLGGLLLTAERA